MGYQRKDLGLRLLDLQHEREALLAYAGAKLRIEDFHAVCDAAVDLREIDTEIAALHRAGVRRADERIRARERRVVKMKYGVSKEEYDVLLKAQHGKCAICGGSANMQKDRLAIDHDHKTGEIRGLLCDLCNIGLGSFHDDPGRLSRAASYLRSGGTQHMRVLRRANGKCR